ncbi:MAG: hypothetical protein IKO41_15215 [Lachnospiraceae bacterium]|nr:hypothetical protein [Lachnospiraceae bacterium]
MLYEYIRKNYADGEPIFLEDIQIDGMNRPNFHQQIKTLTDNGKIVRCGKGIYCLPKRTRLNTVAGPSPETIAQYKYISRHGKTYGYYSGHTFANLMGLSDQVPMKKEIVSNNMAAIVREITIGQQTFIVRRTNVPISEGNVKALQLLDLLKNLGAYLDGDYDEAREKIRGYCLSNGITRTDIDKYIREYPDSTFRNFYEMRLYDILM